MNRKILVDSILHQLSILVSETEIASSSNMQDINLVSEDFYCELLNVIFDCDLVNANELSANFSGVDLIDKKDKVFVQVSSTCTKEKIDHSLDEINKRSKDFEGYNFLFLSLVKSASKLRDKTYTISNNITFDPKENIYDVASIFQKIKRLKIDKVKQVYNICKTNIIFQPNTANLESGITKIINILSSKELSKEDLDIDTVAYDLNQKITVNNLELFKEIINDYKVYYNSIRHVYEEYDKNGNNKSLAILHTLHKMFLESSKQYQGDDIYKSISDKLKDIVINDLKGNDIDINVEDLDLYIDIILIHAFIDCQIYKKP